MTIIDRILNRELIFKNELDRSKYFNYMYNEVPSFGNLTTDSNIPSIIVDISPKFNIPKNKLSEYDNILEYIIKGTKLTPYFTYVYKEPLTKKEIIESSEFSYNNIVNTCNELNFIMSNYYNIFDKIILIFLGKYSEYKYINNILNNYSYRVDELKKEVIFSHHFSYYINNNDKIDLVNINKDINNINKKVISLIS